MAAESGSVAVDVQALARSGATSHATLETLPTDALVGVLSCLDGVAVARVGETCVRLRDATDPARSGGRAAREVWGNALVSDFLSGHGESTVASSLRLVRQLADPRAAYIQRVTRGAVEAAQNRYLVLLRGLNARRHGALASRSKLMSAHTIAAAVLAPLLMLLVAVVLLALRADGVLAWPMWVHVLPLHVALAVPESALLHLVFARVMGGNKAYWKSVRDPLRQLRNDWTMVYFKDRSVVAYFAQFIFRHLDDGRQQTVHPLKSRKVWLKLALVLAGPVFLHISFALLVRAVDGEASPKLMPAALFAAVGLHLFTWVIANTREWYQQPESRFQRYGRTPMKYMQCCGKRPEAVKPYFGPGAAGLTVPISVLLWGAKADGANLSAVHCSIPLMVFFGVLWLNGPVRCMSRERQARMGGRNRLAALLWPCLSIGYILLFVCLWPVSIDAFAKGTAADDATWTGSMAMLVVVLLFAGCYMTPAALSMTAREQRDVQYNNSHWQMFGTLPNKLGIEQDERGTNAYTSTKLVSGDGVLQAGAIQELEELQRRVLR